MDAYLVSGMTMILIYHGIARISFLHISGAATGPNALTLVVRNVAYCVAEAQSIASLPTINIQGPGLVGGEATA